MIATSFMSLYKAELQQKKIKKFIEAFTTSQHFYHRKIFVSSFTCKNFFTLTFKSAMYDILWNSWNCGFIHTYLVALPRSPGVERTTLESVVAGSIPVGAWFSRDLLNLQRYTTLVWNPESSHLAWLFNWKELVSHSMSNKSL